MFEFVTGRIAHFWYKPAGRRQVAGTERKDTAAPAAGGQPETPALSSAVDYRQYIDRFETMSASLADACRQVEPRFLNMGDHLQSIYDRATALTGNAQQSTAIIGDGNGDTVLTRITAMARQALADLDREQQDIRASLDQVQAMAGHIGTLYGLSGQLKNIAKFLKMIGININIESSRSSEAQDVFGALAQEIRELARTVSEVAGGLFEETDRMHSELAGIRSDIQKKLDDFLSLCDAARQTTAKAAPQVQELIRRSMDALQDVGESAATISDSTGQIVMHLQIHDNINQRVDHICQALNDVSQICRQLDESISDAGGPDAAETDTPVVLEKLHAIDAILGIQCAQMQTIVSEIKNARQNSAVAFDHIGGAVRRISAGLEDLASSKHAHDKCFDVDNGRTSVNSLKTALEQIDRLIHRGSRSAEELNAITRKANHAVERFNEHMGQVREVNFEIRLKALNAIFKSNRIGSHGLSIEVLVEEMKELAVQSDELVNQMEQGSREILKVGRMLQSAEERQTPEASVSAGETDFKEAVGQFTRTCEQFRQMAAENVADGQVLAREIMHSDDKLAFLAPFAENFRESIGQLDDIRWELAPLVRAGQADVNFDQQELLVRYTMQQERDIQFKALNQSVASDSMKNDLEPEPAGDADAFGDNVELF